MLNSDAVKHDASIELYSGWATSQRGGYLYGRVHEGKPQPRPIEGDVSVDKLVQTFRDLDLHALPGAHVRLSGFPGSTFFTADDNGFLKVPLPTDMQPGTLCIQAQVDMPVYVSASAATTVQVWSQTSPPVGVISDIDDTLTDSEITHHAEMLKNVFFHNTYDVKVFEGAPEALVAVAGKGASLRPTLPVFYLSGSPWALHERISEAFDRVGLPHGVTILRRYSQESLNPFHFKHPHLLEIVDSNPGYKWILLGDTGEKDPEVYHTLMEERPGVVDAVFIHNVSNANPEDSRFADFSVFNRWAEVVEAIQRRKLGLYSNETAIVQA
jgi:phosphatidate phosphatase APP1